MGLTAIECPDGVCHSHHGGHAVERSTMQNNLQGHGREWCERLAERIYEISVDTFSQTVMPSLHSAGWQRRHLDWEFKLDKQESEPDKALVDGIINATESF
ncbi:MAG: EF-1 guanine nucleotide exchange domain-containing protein, partial [Cyanobacteriota bacterium]|nr:EF-1 guanine nucleotide exchange domain-containing protein [Cyanobacteriota bacterium]